MASFNPSKYKPLTIDGVQSMMPYDARIIDVVPKEVTAVSVVDSSGQSQLIERAHFHRSIPEGFTTHLTHVEKG